ncbi:MAG: hypothetical protein D6675_07580 [Gemmatimonadetes bacterium]|nr:MAG: hypothetical protein D6675_07580 [Gemmatimonadota bacterium]
MFWNRESDAERIAKFEAFKAENNYRRSSDRTKSCGTCHFFKIKRWDRTAFKCERADMSKSPETDILKNYVCDQWERTA